MDAGTLQPGRAEGGKEGPASRPLPRLLAVDAGLRAGIAVYDAQGRLEAYRSTNFGSHTRLKSGVYSVMNDVEGLERVVVEGGGSVADPWLREAQRRGLACTRVDAGVWRKVLLLSRDQRSGADAKRQADDLARRVIIWSGARRPVALRHDAAEAILIGLWGVMEAEWLSSLPLELRP